jgi:alkylation response protein AidB-like acyl-CoA dehydrogenase
MTSKVLNLHGDLPPETLELIHSARSWGEKELEPLIPKHWEEASFPPHILSSFRRHCPNLLGYTLPKKYGGAGYDLLSACHISKTLASIDASFVTVLLVQYGLCAESILLCGSEDQKNRLLPSLARLETMGCFCLTGTFQSHCQGK